jgi:hypothetical protein
MKMKRYLYFAFLTTISISCEKVLINEEISNNQQKVFEILWNDFDRNYAGFTVRNIDWDSVYNTTMDTINIGISEDNFQKIVIDILLSFKDIHVGFVNPNGVQVVYNATNPNSSNRIVSIDRYIDSPSENRIFKWGQITNENIGYIHIKTFNESLFLDFRQIDALIRCAAYKKSQPHKQHIWFLPTQKPTLKKPKELLFANAETEIECKKKLH